MTDMTFTAENAEPETVIDFRTAVEQQNAALTEQLAQVGKAPTPLFFLANQIATLIDIVFDDEGDREQFDCAVAVAVNTQLRAAVENAASQLVVPSSVG